jgi:hypothetical protein
VHSSTPESSTSSGSHRQQPPDCNAIVHAHVVFATVIHLQVKAALPSHEQYIHCTDVSLRE